MANLIAPGFASSASASNSEQMPVAGTASQSSWQTALAQADGAQAAASDPAKAVSHFVLYSVLKEATIRTMNRLEQERREANEDSD